MKKRQVPVSLLREPQPEASQLSGSKKPRRAPGSKAIQAVSSHVTPSASAESDPGEVSAHAGPRPCTGLHLLLHASIPLLSSRAQLLSSKLKALGARVDVASDYKGSPKASTAGTSHAQRDNYTHIVVGPGHVLSLAEVQELVSQQFATAARSARPAHKASPLQPTLRRAAATASPGGDATSSQNKLACTASGSASKCDKLGLTTAPKVVEVAWIESILATKCRQHSPTFQLPLGGQSDTDGGTSDDGVVTSPHINQGSALQPQLVVSPRGLSGPTENAAAMQQQQQSWYGVSSRATAGVPRIVPEVGLLPVFRGHPVGDVRCAPSDTARLGRYARWLGYWHPWLDGAQRLPELMMWPKYNAARSEALGNEHVVQLLVELMKYEEALAGSKGDPGDADVNHRALSYAHAASAVRGCSFSLAALAGSQRTSGIARQASHELSDNGGGRNDNGVAAAAVSGSVGAGRRGGNSSIEKLGKTLSKLMPFLGSAYTSRLVGELIITGTSDKLERLRKDEPVTDSLGNVRHGSEGASTRRMFCRLPSVGPASAWTFWLAGCRTYQDVQDWLQSQVEASGDHSSASQVLASVRASHVNEGGHASSSRTLTQHDEEGGGVEANIKSVRGAREMLYSAQHHVQLTEALPEVDAAEMRKVLQSGLEEVTGVTGWQLVTVGGGRRSKQAHDADFLATHPTHSVEGVVPGLYELLVRRGKLVPKEVGFCRVQAGRNIGYLDRVRLDVADEKWAFRHQMDRYDHIYGLWITDAGHRRRMDIIFVPQSTWWWGLVGWTGSKQLLRFMRTHAGDLGMRLNSHFLLRPHPDGSRAPALLVPHEAAPLGRDCQETWPPGWQSGRQVECEADLFELLGVPCWDPTDRNCP